ncbi:MAG: alpha/beta hydrolase [Elainellaceae cyanobacterium]
MKLTRRNLSGVLLAVAACLSTQARAVAQSTDSETIYPTTEIPCPVALPLGEVEGETITCGYLTVPENYDEPDGRQVEITYAVLHSRSLSPLANPVIDLRGGPGGSTIDALETRSVIYEPLRQTRDVVVFDQRGTKFSSRLGCAPAVIALDDLLEDPNLGDELSDRFEQFISGLDDDEPLTNEQATAYYSICAQLLELHGADLSQYNTPNNARDTVNLFTALGYDDVNLYGISYGTYLASQVMRDYPERLRSVVLDSTVPPQNDKYEDVPRYLEVVLFNLIDDCEANVACNAAYPNLQERTITLFESLAQTPLSVTTVDPFSPDQVDEITITPENLVSFVEQLNTDPRLSPYLPRLIHELEQGITTTFEGITTGTIFTEPAPEPIEVGTVREIILRAEDLRADADDILRAEAALAQTQRPSSQWVRQVKQQVEALPESEQPRALDNLIGVGYQPGLPRDRTTLLTYVDEIFPEEAGQSLRAELQRMSEIEVRHVYEVLSDVADEVYPGLDSGTTAGMFRSLDCREQVAFSTTEETLATYNSMDIPVLGDGKLNAAGLAYGICSQWPVEPGDPSDHQVLESDIPTLVLQGRYDSQTPTFMASLMVEGLTSGTIVEFPNSGHGVILWSQCARDVGVAFVNQPTEPIDTSCVPDVQPDFVLLDAVLPTPIPEPELEPEEPTTLLTSTNTTTSGITTYTTLLDFNTIRVEISEPETFYFRGALTQVPGQNLYIGSNEWVQVTLAPATGRVTVVQIRPGQTVYDYTIDPVFVGEDPATMCDPATEPC